MRNRLLMIPVLLLSMAGLSVSHAQATGQAANSQAYTSTSPVANTSDAQRNHAFAVALGSILVHTAGQSMTTAPGFTEALGNAASLVQDYQYQRAPKGASQPFVLKMEFDPGAVQLLAKKLKQQLLAEQPAADASAPKPEATTVWVAPMTSAVSLASLLSTVRADSKVTSAEPVGADGKGVMLRIDSQASQAALIRSLQAGGQLQAAASSHPGADASLHWMD